MAATTPSEPTHWLDFYASSTFHNWHRTTQSDANGATSTLFYRRQGIVENIFDSDGNDYEGRADLNINPHVELRTRLDANALRSRIGLVWSVMRNRHLLLAAKSIQGFDQGMSWQPQGHEMGSKQSKKWAEKCFVYQVPANSAGAIRDGQESIVFLDQMEENGLSGSFYVHLMNTARPIVSAHLLAKLYVYPPIPTKQGTYDMQFVIVAGHQIADGLTVYRWSHDFISLLNWEEQDLHTELNRLCVADTVPDRLPPCQESIYPPLASNPVRLRWKWLITRILRHVRRPPPASFQNPLRRSEPLATASDLPHTYSQYLDYSRKPPLNSYTIQGVLSTRATRNMIRLCRQARISIGSGSFTLAGLVMMRLEELRNPRIPHAERLPFVGSFPVNPRPFLSGEPTTGKEDSLMLAFSDGVTLPFVTSDHDLQKSFRVLGRLAHRQLRQYQKKKRTSSEELELGSRSPSQLLPMLYLLTLERMDYKVLSERRTGLNPQGGYPASIGKTMATCGISSVGDRTSLISRGIADVDQVSNKDLIADFRDLKNAVRAREGEFLIGASGTTDTQGYVVSYDGSVIDPRRAEQWKILIENILEFDMSEDGPDIAANL